MEPSANDLDVWLREFNSPTTTNEQKKEIQLRLHEFQVNGNNNWQLSLQQLASCGSNQGLWLFHVATVEMKITSSWTALQLSDRLAIRNFLWQSYLGFHYGTSKLERFKIAQLIALIGKREFPEHQPGFMNEVIELMRRNLLYGITLLRCTSECCTSTKEDLTTDQKKYFQSCLTLCLPEVFDVINKFMAIQVCKLLKTDPAEIPADYKDLRLLRALPTSGSDQTIFLKIFNEFLECVQHLFSWIPLSPNLSEFLLNSLFLLAKWRPGGNDEVATNALCAISELFYRQVAIPHLPLIANGILQLVQEEAVVKTSPELYQDKLTELLCLFTTQHSSKWLQDDSFPNLLFHLYQFTFNSYGALAFTERLNMWIPIVNGLPDGFRKHHDILFALLVGILDRMQFKNDQQEWLELLDNSTLDDDLETEWQHFLAQCIEVVALIADGAPEQAMEAVINAWRVPFEAFFVIEKAIINGDHNLTFLNPERPDAQSKCHYIHCILRDLSSLCQTFSRLAPILEQCSNRISELVKTVAISLVLSVKFMATKKPYKLKSVIFNDEIQADLIDMFSQMLSALKGILPWVNHLKLESYVNSITDLSVQLLIESNSKVAVSGKEPKLISLAAAQLLLSITTTIRPKHLLDTHQMLQLMNFGLELYENDQKVALPIYKAICNTFLLPWTGVNANLQQFNSRAKSLENFLLQNVSAKFMAHYDELIAGRVGGMSNEFLQVTELTLAVQREILDYYADASSITKQMLIPPMKELAEKVLEIFQNYSTNPSLSNAIFMFLLSFIQTLQIQLGHAYIKDMLAVLLGAILASNKMAQSGNSIEKLVQILCLIVKNSAASTQQVLLPSILELTLDHIVPFLGQQATSWTQYTDIFNSVYVLFDGILLNHWQYFYKSGVLRKIKSDSSLLLNVVSDEIQHQDKFLAIMSLYGRALVSGNSGYFDPHVIDIVLKSLQKLNEHWKLYHKEIFQTHLLSSFQYALIGALIAPEGSLCYDQLMATLYTMGQANNKLLHDSFLTYGFPSDHKLVHQICLSTDLPTFSHQMAQLIQDTRCQNNSGSTSALEKSF